MAKRKSRAFAKKVNDNVVAFKKNVTPSRVSVVSELNDQPAKTKKVAEPALAWPLRNIYTRQLVA